MRTPYTAKWIKVVLPKRDILSQFGARGKTSRTRLEQSEGHVLHTTEPRLVVQPEACGFNMKIVCLSNIYPEGIVQVPY